MKEVKNILLLLIALLAVGCSQTIIFEDGHTPTPELNIPNNEIWYTSKDGTVVEPDSSADFGATIVSNTYENGKGVIKFNKDLYTIGQYAFDHKPILTVVLPKTVRVIEKDAFSYTPLKSVVLSDELTSIGAEAFEYCNLETIDFGDFIGDVGEFAFRATDVDAVYVSSLPQWCSIDFGGWDANPLAGGGGATCLYVNNEKLTTLTFHNGLTEIKPYLFNHCKDLEEVVIHDNITRIGKHAFRYSDVRKVTIGKNVQYIGDSAFNCLSLMEIHCKSLTPPELEKVNVFAQLHSSCKIYVPFESLDLYKSAYGWSEYKNQIVTMTTSAPYAVGDYYNDGIKEGVVFEIWDNGNSGKILSMTQSTSTIQWTSDLTEQNRLVGANSETDGAVNMAVVKAISGWQSKYPAFKWCADLGSEWYLPAKEELLTIYNGKDKLNTKLTDELISESYWSSTECDQLTSGEYCAWGVSMYNSCSTESAYKRYYKRVRAVTTFGNVPKPEPEPEPEPDLDYSTANDLSAAGTANCYLVKTTGKYKFKAVKGNSAQSVGAASSADVLWESFGTSTKPNEGDLMASAIYKDGYVYFATPNTFKSGNASIAVRNSSGTILWSWHIWCSAEGWTDDIYLNNAGAMMDRNLGATSATPGDVGAFGLLYQWGRKDPFLGSCSISSNRLAVSTGSWNSVSTQQTVDYVTANPMIYVCGNSEWCIGDGANDSNYTKRWIESAKSMYDPCPVGYRIPDGGNDGFWARALGTSNATSAGTTWDSTNKGHHWTLSDGTTAWYPVVGVRNYDSGALHNVGLNGYCWSASPNPGYSYSAYHLYFNSGYVLAASGYNRGYGQSVRCVRE